MKYYIHVEETRTAVVEVEAGSEEEALEKVESAYNEDEVSLNSADYITDTDFEDETEIHADMVKRGYPVNYIKLG